MSFKTQAIMSVDGQLRNRIAACAAKEGLPMPAWWADNNQWALAAQPGWDAAYASALAAGKEDIGNDESVITDGMILSGVQAIK